MWETIAFLGLCGVFVKVVIDRERKKKDNKTINNEAADYALDSQYDTPVEKNADDESIAIWLNSIEHEFGCKILCESSRSIWDANYSTKYIVNGREYKGKVSLQCLKVESIEKSAEYNFKDLRVYKDSYGDNVFAVINDDVPTFDEYDREYDGQHFLFFFHNKDKISAMYCSEGYRLGTVRIFENITR